jgi:hypothetical protein
MSFFIIAKNRISRRSKNNAKDKAQVFKETVGDLQLSVSLGFAAKSDVEEELDRIVLKAKRKCTIKSLWKAGALKTRSSKR